MDDYTDMRATQKLLGDRTIAALFTSATKADTARDALKSAGFKDVAITRSEEIEIGNAPGPIHKHSFWDGLTALFGSGEDAHLYGEGVRRGHNLVTVHVSDTRAAEAIAILDAQKPVNIDDHAQMWRSQGWTAEGASTEPSRRDPTAGNGRVRSYLQMIDPL